MFAKSEKITGVGGEHIPLFAKQTPLPVTVSAKAGGSTGVKQYQLCILQSTGTIMPANEMSGISPLSNGQVLCVAAYAAKTNEMVTVYTQGTFNINVIEFGEGLFGSSKIEPAKKLEKLFNYGSSAIFFENCETNPVQRT